MKKAATNVYLLAASLMLSACAGATGTASDGGSGGDSIDVTDGGFSSCGVVYAREGALHVVSNGVIKLFVDTVHGTYSIRAEGGAAIELAESRIVLGDGDSEETFGTSTPGKRAFSAVPSSDALGCGVAAVLSNTPKNGGPAIETRIEVRSGAGYITASSTASWAATPPEGTLVLRFSPLVADGATKGSLAIGRNPLSHRVLDNGFDMYFDYTARVYTAGSIQSMLFGPGSASNYNMAILDPATGRSVVAGFLSMDKGMGIVAIDPGEDAAENGAFRRFDGFGYYMDGKPPVAGEKGPELRSEIFYADLAPGTVFDGLERYAERYAHRIGKKIKTEIPTGWNSWGGGSGSGGYGTAIDRALIMENMEHAASDYLPYGMNYFMIDDGWQIAEGDWTPNPQRFPPAADGMRSIADEARARGMIPGIWCAPFSVKEYSALAKEHPEWMLKPGGIGAAMAPKDTRLLDVSNPEALKWLGDLYRKMSVDWGYRWFKTDFTYYVMFMTGMHDPSLTQFEAYRNAVRVIREAIGPDAFLVGIAGNGAWMDFSDGQRLSLDTEPWWGDPPEDQGIKPTYQSLVRKYYMNHRLWINHMDLLFFRQDYGMTLNESRVLASVLALSGGIFKLGDSYVAMHRHDDWRAITYRMLPAYPRTGRPLDLFYREYPEVWDLRAERGGKSWHVVGLFNWGLNRNIEAKEWEPERDRTYELNLSSLGFGEGRVLAIESWSGGHWWIGNGVLSRTVKPRHDDVVILRAEPEEPAFVYTDRHLLGTAVEVSTESWDGEKLAARVLTVPGAPVRVMAATAGRQVAGVTADSAAGLNYTTVDGVLEIAFTPGKSSTEVNVTFAGK